MDLLNVVPENHDYDGLNENSSDIERLDVVFKILQKSSSPVWLDYGLLFIPKRKEKCFQCQSQKYQACLCPGIENGTDFST